MQTSGLVLDVYDDYTGNVLRGTFPNIGDVPSTIKQAHALSHAERERLPDDAYALILVNGVDRLRKYACIDRGNTELSLLYFFENGHKLPEEAQKVAAAYLTDACVTFDIKPPEELQKIALLGAVLAVPTTLETAKQIRDNSRIMSSVSPHGAGGVVTPKQLEEMQTKGAEIVGTTDMPLSAPPPSVGGHKAVIKKTAGADSDLEKAIMGKQPASMPQVHVASRAVDVTNSTPPKVMTEKKAYRYALPAQEKYPLDSYQQVKTASSYFDTYSVHFSPEDRREYCLNLVPRADELNIKVSSVIRAYAGSTFADADVIKVAFDARRSVLHGQFDELAILNKIEKVARERVWVDSSGNRTAASESVLQSFWKTAAPSESHAPWAVASALVEFDKAAGIDIHYDTAIPDPYASVYGMDKVADDSAWSEIIGNDYINADGLKRLASMNGALVQSAFNAEFLKEFQAQPVDVFKSLPAPQKVILMRMAGQVQPGNETTF